MCKGVSDLVGWSLWLEAEKWESKWVGLSEKKSICRYYEREPWACVRSVHTGEGLDGGCGKVEERKMSHRKGRK